MSGQNSSTNSICECLMREIGKCIPIQCVWSFLEPHFNYWWCFDSNIQELTDEIWYFKGQTYDVRQRIEAARLNAETLRPWVQEWLEADTDEETTRILAAHNPNKWNFISRYSTGKSAKQAAEKIAKHRNDGNFNSIADPAPPACMASISQTQTMDFESRKPIEEDIMESLKNSRISTIAICGMVGVGKTTMAERIGKRWKEENKLDEVVMVVVGQQMETLKIQKEIAELLGLTLNVETKTARANLLRTRLMDTKRKIIIFDDVRESLKLKDFGISFDSHLIERCKILLTSRSKDVFREMGAVKVLEINILTEEESWSLFKEKAGERAEHPKYRPVAVEIVAKCNGLPITLVKKGELLNGRTKYVWEDVLSDLKGHSSPGVGDVYKSLKLCYDCLDNNERDLFLLCCLFPKNYNISVEQLSWYSMGLQMFDRETSVKDAKNKTRTWVDNIKRRFLLIDGHQVKPGTLLHVKSQELHVEIPGLHVKMDSSVRNVAIYIGSQEKNGFLKILNKMPIKSSSDVQCHWMSVDISNEGMEFPVGLCFPELRHLMLLRSNFSDISFKETEILKVLSFPSTSIGSLPQTLGLLKNLQTLCLLHCQVENISVIGELKSLKILSCYGCKNIRELPAEIEGLNGLRLLELYECSNLQGIPFGIISRLVELEELKISRSFSEWDTGGERRNAAVKELESLPNLTCLEIEISDCNLAGQKIGFLKELDKYYIRIGPKDYYYSQDGDYEKVMILNLPSHNGVVGQWIQNQVKNTEYLSLEGDGSNNFNIAEIENLRNLRFQRCSTVKKLVNTSDYNYGRVFLWLESLALCELEELEEISDGTIPLGSGSFSRLEELQVCKLPKLTQLLKSPNLWNLKSIKIESCSNLLSVFPDSWESPNLRNLKSIKIKSCSNLLSVFPESWESPNLCNLKSINIESCSNLLYGFPESMARRCLLQLEVLEIQYCDKLERVFWNEITGETIEFPKLKTLTLTDLPNLTVFCQGVKTIKFPNLTKMKIGGLPNLNSFFPLNSETPHEDTTSLHFLCNPKVCFEMLMGGLSNRNSFSPLNSETPHDDTTSFHFLCNPKVEMGSLNKLSLTGCLEDNLRNIWCRQIPPNFFDQLRELKIYHMHGIESLLTYPIAKNFVNLRSLCIEDCKVMVEVIKADALEAVDHMPFPTLKLLSITKLLELRSFWPVNHPYLELPLLEYVDIQQCPVMNTFTSGSLKTPKIRKIVINHDQIDDEKDLNCVMQKYINHDQIDDEKDLNCVMQKYGVTSVKQNNDEDNRDKNSNENGEESSFNSEEKERGREAKRLAKGKEKLI